MDDVTPDQDGGGWSQLTGGPCDGRVDPLDPETVELQIIMTDGQQHLYRRTDLRREVDGRIVVLFEWAGRQFGPR